MYFLWSDLEASSGIDEILRSDSGAAQGLVGFRVQSHLFGTNQLLCLPAQNAW